MKNYCYLNYETLERRQLLAADTFLINEFMAANDSGLTDQFGEMPDWIELRNDSDRALDLQGWSLTDNPAQVGRWVFPDSHVVAPNDFVVVMASGRDTVIEGEAHTNFKLKSGGEYIGLADPTGNVVSQFGDTESEYPNQQADVSYGLDANGRERYFLSATPGSANDDSSGGIVADTKFSVDRGFYDEPFDVTIDSRTANATLVYTLDGSTPSPTNGTQVSGADSGPSATIRIDSTSTLRAMAFREDWTSTNVDTQTYVFLGQVVKQTGDGLPNTWGHAGADYEMDPAVVESPRYRDVIEDSLTAIPTVSLVTDIDNWFGQSGKGIYPEGQSSPRGVSMEMLFPETGDDVQVDGSVEIQGGSSTYRWKSDKLSMQLKFKREYGDAKLDYPVLGDAATDEFDTLILDARLNQAWHYGGGVSASSQRDRAQYTRDQFVANLQRELGGEAPRGHWVHLYLNGTYWGMYNLHERPDEHFAEAYLGGDKEDYDIIKHNDDVVHGSIDAYRDFLQLVNRNMRSDSNYEAVVSELDVDQFINYMLTNYFVGNTDWAHHNWYASHNEASGDGLWRYHSWDAEHVLKSSGDDATTRNDEMGPTHVHVQLMRNENYKLKFMDAVQEYFYNDGKLTPDKTIELYQERLDEVELAVVAESARWGDNHRSRPFTRDVEWVRERDRLMNDYFPSRTEIVLEQLRDRGYFHRYDAPKFNEHGGSVESGFELTISSAGTVFYTTDGSDPRTSNTAFTYGSPLEITQSATIKTRALRGADEWSAVTEATFLVGLEGDFSGDGVLNAADVDVIQAAISGDNRVPQFDLDANGSIDSSDVDYWLGELANTRRGDANLDGSIDFEDFLLLSANFGSTEASWGEGDFDEADGIAFSDFLILSTNFGWTRA